MRRVRSVFFAFGAAFVAIAVWSLPRAPSDKPPHRTLNVYDSALLTLRDFVANGDDKLGFSDVREFDHAHIDLKQGVSVYFLRHDTARSTFNWYDTLLMDLGRVVYPVYVENSGQEVLRSSITFDSIGGVHPVMFDDSTLILASVKHRRTMKNANARYAMIMVPSLGVNAFVAHTDSGDTVLETDELRRALGPNFHRGMGRKELVHAVGARMRAR